MFLTELQEKLREEQTKRGNVPLSRVHVMHEHTVLVAHSDSLNNEPSGEAQAETENPPPPSEFALFQETLRDLLAIPVDDRLARCEPEGCVPITHEELAQLLEFRDELKASYQTKSDAARRDVVSIAQSERAEQLLGETMEAAAAKLPEGETTTIDMPGTVTLNLKTTGEPVSIQIPDTPETLQE